MTPAMSMLSDASERRWIFFGPTDSIGMGARLAFLGLGLGMATRNRVVTADNEWWLSGGSTPTTVFWTLPG